jgi:hypothetical protein
MPLLQLSLSQNLGQVHKSLIILACFIFPFIALGQKQVGMQQYYYWQQKTMGTIVPKVYYQSPQNLYGELRYNYEETETASVHFGKKFAFKKFSALEIIPVGGIIFGKLNGSSIGSIVEINLNKFCFCSEPQYVFSFNQKEKNYFYSWSEASYAVFSFFYAGLALQQTKPFSLPNSFEPGIMGGFSIKNFDIPVYCFNPTTSSKNFVLGVNWRWEK